MSEGHAFCQRPNLLLIVNCKEERSSDVATLLTDETRKSPQSGGAGIVEEVIRKKYWIASPCGLAMTTHSIISAGMSSRAKPDGTGFIAKLR